MRPPAARDLLRLYRVADWLHFLPLPLAGWVAGGARDPRALAGGVAGWGLALAYTSAVNQAFDDRLDRRHAGKNPVGARVTRRAALALAAPPAAAAVAVVAWLAPAGLGATAALLAAATVYSAPPRLKRVPVVGTLWNVVIALPGLVLAGGPGAYPGAYPGALRLLAGLFALLLVVSQLLHEAADREDDRAGGVATVAVLAGTPGALAAAAAVLAALPVATCWLAAGLGRRTPLVVATAVFAAGWLAALARRLGRAADGAAGLRGLRLRYRYTALALGAVAFLAAR